MSGDFKNDIAYSQTALEDTYWQSFYRRRWPDMIECPALNDDGPDQRKGIDRRIIRANGQNYTVDEKLRRSDYGDILLEIVDQVPPSKFVNNVLIGPFEQYKPGWTVDPKKVCDFVAYAIPVSSRAYLIPFESLRHAAIKNAGRWLKESNRRWVAARNPRDQSVAAKYYTLNLALSPETIFSAIQDEWRSYWGPPPVIPDKYLAMINASKLKEMEV